jgi:hypothetical protein
MKKHFSLYKILAVLLFLASAMLNAGVLQSLENFKHSLGWDTFNLDLIEKDPAGRPTLERQNNTANLVERKTSYHANGQKNTQTFTVLAKGTDNMRTLDKRVWNENGNPESLFTQDNSFNSKGEQTQGQIIELSYNEGRLATETKKKFYNLTGDWALTYKQSISYYKDGDMKERVTERLPENNNKRETWSETKRSLGREQTTQKWNPSISQWQ